MPIAGNLRDRPRERPRPFVKKLEVSPRMESALWRVMMASRRDRSGAEAICAARSTVVPSSALRTTTASGIADTGTRDTTVPDCG